MSANEDAWRLAHSTRRAPTQQQSIGVAPADSPPTLRADQRAPLMCGRASISISRNGIVQACQTAGVALPPGTEPPAEYHVGSKSAEEKTRRNPAGKRGVEGWPCILLENGALAVRTLTWGIARLSTHCIWVEPGDEWSNRKTWADAIKAGRLCAVAVTAFAEGITCRRPDDSLFFLAALYVGGHFVLITTNACTVPILQERSLKSASLGVPTRCPLYMDAAAATEWLQTGRDMAAALAAIRRLEAGVRSPAARPQLALGSGKAAGGSASPRSGSTGLLRGSSRGGSAGSSSSSPSAASAPAMFSSSGDKKRRRDDSQARGVANDAAASAAAAQDRIIRQREEADLQRAIAMSLREQGAAALASPPPPPPPSAAARGPAAVGAAGSANAPIALESDDDEQEEEVGELGARVEGDSETEEDEPTMPSSSAAASSEAVDADALRAARLARFGGA